MMLDLSKIVPKEILTKSGNKTYPLHIAYLGEKVLIANTKNKHSDIWYPRYITVPEGTILLWYSWPTGRNQSQDKNTGLRYNYLVLPRYIPLDQLTMNTLGLLQAEMTKGNIRKSNLSFTNSEPSLINVVMKFFNRLGIKHLDWSWSITSNFKLKRIENQSETSDREIQAKSYWLQYTDVNSSKIRNKPFQYTGNKHCENRWVKTMKLGSLRIDHSNIILYLIVRKMLDDIETLLHNQSTIIHYLQGVFAGEASVKPTKYESLDNVDVGAVFLKDQKFYATCLLKLDIHSSFEKNCIRIHNMENFLKIHKYNLLELHPLRQAKFLHHLSRYKQIPQRLKASYSSFKEEVKDVIC
ncbi:MAG: hypothetical protein AABX24_00875 [Nanoarchaeota archaeon]